jgi:AcrR family transcriptional regulator
MARRATNVTRTRIQETALVLFSTRGYEATSLQEIAAALDVTKAALYYHFPSKAALLQSLADPFLDAEQALLDGYGADPLTATARRALVRALADLLLEYRPIVAWLAQDITAAAQPGIAERVAEHAERVQQLLVGCTAGGAARVRAAAAMGALTRPFTALPDLDLDVVQDTVVAAALDALGA